MSAQSIPEIGVGVRHTGRNLMITANSEVAMRTFTVLHDADFNSMDSDQRELLKMLFLLLGMNGGVAVRELWTLRSGQISDHLRIQALNAFGTLLGLTSRQLSYIQAALTV